MQAPTVPAPLPRTQDPMDDAFWQQCQDGRLRFQQCDRCGAGGSAALHVCTVRVARVHWTPVKGVGSLYSWTITRKRCIRVRR